MATDLKSAFDKLFNQLAIISDNYDCQYDIVKKNCHDIRSFLQYVENPISIKTFKEESSPGTATHGTKIELPTNESVSVLSQDELLAIESLLQKSQFTRQEYPPKFDAKRLSSQKTKLLPTIKSVSKESPIKQGFKSELKNVRKQSTTNLKMPQLSKSSKTGAIPKNKQTPVTLPRNSENETKLFDLHSTEGLTQNVGHLKFSRELQKMAKQNQNTIDSTKMVLFSDCPARDEFLQKIQQCETDNAELKLAKKFSDLKLTTESLLNSDLNDEEVKTEIEQSVEKFGELNSIYLKLTNEHHQKGKTRCVKKENPKMNDDSSNSLREIFNTERILDDLFYQDSSKALKYTETICDTQWLKLQLYLHEQLNQFAIPMIQNMPADDENFVPFLRCLFGLLCSEGSSFPIFLKK